MNVSQMMNLLALRLEDAGKVDFPDNFKLLALNNSQTSLANKLHNNYLTELQVVDTNKTVTTGACAISTLSYDVLRGGQGIRKLKVNGTSGLYITMIELDDVKKMENTLIGGNTSNPIGYIFQNTIYVIPTSITSIDVYYLRVPAPLYYPFNMIAATTPSKSAFLGDSSSDAVDDYWKYAVIYCVGQKSYHVVYATSPTLAYDLTGNADGEKHFTVVPDAAANFGTDTFYFVTHGFDTLNLTGVTCQLNETLHELAVTLAEAECWAMSHKLDRRAAALETAYAEIAMLNSRYETERAEGIGTDRKGR